MKKNFYILYSLVFLNACAYVNGVSLEKPRTKDFSSYRLVDQSGEFELKRAKGYSSKDQFVVKKKLFRPKDLAKEIEKSITISTPKKNQNGINIYEPTKAESIYWLDGKEYKSTLSFNRDKKRITVRLKSPEEDWNGEKSTEITNELGVYCFFSQLVECVARTGFFKISREKKAGQMNFNVLWDGFPYFNEQYLGASNRVNSPGRLRYLGAVKDGHVKYQLEIEEQIIFYFIYQDSYLAKMYWVSQGLSITVKN